MLELEIGKWKPNPLKPWLPDSEKTAGLKKHLIRGDG
jgi:hypothetical protein